MPDFLFCNYVCKLKGDTMKKVIVIGAGAAGMMAAGACVQNGAEVIIIEKNKIVGKKLRITGKGRCNITNNCDPQEFIKNVPSNGSFLYSAINRFPPVETIKFFKDRGLRVKVERGNRVFPESDKAIDVVNVLKEFTGNCKLVMGRVVSLLINDGKCIGVKNETGEKIFANSVIVATGGKSYPLTGSTGDGYKLAKQAGHTIVNIRPSLIPLIIKEKWCKDLQGLSLKNVKVCLKDKEKNKIVYEDFGEMLFTHFGVSGPVILSLSVHIDEANIDKYEITIDLKPALDFAQLDKRLIRDFEKFHNKDFINSLIDLLPRKLIPIVVKLSSIPGNKKCNEITKAERQNLVKLLKNLNLNVESFRPIDEAIITAGGVSTKEINPKTMESKYVKGLYFCGEVLDVDAYTGGYNLQIAFSTGFLAGKEASRNGGNL